MTFIRQKNEGDCGVAAIAMLCDATYDDADFVIPWRRVGSLYGTDTKMLRAAALRLGYEGRGTPQHRLKVVKAPKSWANLTTFLPEDFWALIPSNSLVKIPHPKGRGWGWHWVAWRKGHIYDPARGVFTPGNFGVKPSSYMHFVPEGTENCLDCGTPTEVQHSGIKCPSCGWTYCT